MLVSPDTSKDFLYLRSDLSFKSASSFLMFEKLSIFYSFTEFEYSLSLYDSIITIKTDISAGLTPPILVA